MTNWKCVQCGLWNQREIKECRRCGQNKFANLQRPFASQAYPQQQAMAIPLPVQQGKQRGKTCMRCGVTNSDSELTGMAIVLLFVLFITCLGLILIPFLPKTWTCRNCGFVW